MRTEIPVVPDATIESVTLLQGTALNATREQELLSRFSPAYVLFPEAPPGHRPPDNSTYDYHPRDVRVYLDRITRAGNIQPHGPFALAWLAFVAGTSIFAAAVLLFVTTGTQYLFFISQEAVGGLFVLLVVLLLVSGYGFFGRDRRTASDLASLLEGDLVGGLPVMYMAAAASFGGRESLWKDYCEEIKNTPDRHPRTIYGRCVRSGGHTVLEYWAFYLYNDWQNKHEGDWEVVMIHLPDASDALDKMPVAAAYSSHLGGRWRPWNALELVDGHPVVYVARGSHAQYFVADKKGYETALDERWEMPMLKGELRVFNWRRDVVPVRADVAPKTYVLVEIPAQVEEIGPGDPGWLTWWWIRFRGGWGPGPRIEGPAVQASRWANPSEWASTSCRADTGQWQALFH